MNRKDGPEVFAAWILLVQLASRCTTRGVLASSDGRAYEIADISVKTRAPERIFEKAIPLLVGAGWITTDSPISAGQDDPSGESADASGLFPDIGAANRIEKKRKNGINMSAPKWRDIYNLYPRKVSPRRAEKAIVKALKEKPYEALKEAVEAYAKAVKHLEAKFIPHPATWFNNGSYDDDRSMWGVNAENFGKPVGNNTSTAHLEQMKRETEKLMNE